MKHAKLFWSAPAERSGDGALRTRLTPRRSATTQSGVALRLPPHSTVALANARDAQSSLTSDLRPLPSGPWALDNEIAADGWCLIAPFGEWPKTRRYREGGRVKEQQFIQVLDHAAADALLSKENSFFGRLKRALIGVPVFKGHGDEPEVDPQAVTQAVGKIKLGVVDQLRKGARGLEAHFALDADGAEAVRAGWKFPSGFWYVLPVANEGLGSRVSGLGCQATDHGAIRCRPFKLISVALTPYPNISGVESLANAANHDVLGKVGQASSLTIPKLDRQDACSTLPKVGQASSLTIPKTDRQDACPTLPNPSGAENLASAAESISREVQPNIESDMKLITGWLLAHGVALANADHPTEPQILEALQRLHASAAADVTALGNEKQTLSGALAALTTERDRFRRTAEETATALANEQGARSRERQGRAEATVDLAIQRGKLTVAQRDVHLTALVNSTDFDAAARALLAGPTVVKTAGQEVQSGKQNSALSNETQQLQAEYNQAFQTELIATGQNPARAHDNIMRLPKYAGLAAKLLPRQG
jgi:hypothetical protein